MTREQILVSAFASAIREIGLEEFKKTSMFSQGQKRVISEEDRLAA